MNKLTKILKETTDNKTYKSAHRYKYGRCWRCGYHGSLWSSCSDVMWKHRYHYIDDGTNKPYKERFHDHPSWKLVSKNRKQWMRKKFITSYARMPNGGVYIELGWI